jgi:hypothetical protein
VEDPDPVLSGESGWAEAMHLATLPLDDPRHRCVQGLCDDHAGAAAAWPDGKPVTPWADPWHDIMGDLRAVEHSLPDWGLLPPYPAWDAEHSRRALAADPDQPGAGA